MSYILEALKKAEAERQRGAVPTLQSLGGAAPPAEAAAAKPMLRYALIGVALLALLLIGLLISRWWPTPAAAPQVAVLPAPAPAPLPARVEPRVMQPAPSPAPPPRVVEAAPKPVAPPVVTEAASAPVPTLAELPESLRRSLPPLKLGGSMYSDTPAARMLIINSVVYHEGDSLAPGLKLETIGARRAQLSYNGQRFTLDY